jgi:hypothetical protein
MSVLSGHGTVFKYNDDRMQTGLGLSHEENDGIMEVRKS